MESSDSGSTSTQGESTASPATMAAGAEATGDPLSPPGLDDRPVRRCRGGASRLADR